MGKILEPEFRKELYKNLVDAGYTKEEAQKIVGVKYFSGLKENLLNSLDDIKKHIDEDNFANVKVDCEFFNKTFAELNKLRELIK